MLASATDLDHLRDGGCDDWSWRHGSCWRRSYAACGNGCTRPPGFRMPAERSPAGGNPDRRGTPGSALGNRPPLPRSSGSDADRGRRCTRAGPRSRGSNGSRASARPGRRYGPRPVPPPAPARSRSDRRGSPGRKSFILAAGTQHAPLAIQVALLADGIRKAGLFSSSRAGLTIVMSRPSTVTGSRTWSAPGPWQRSQPIPRSWKIGRR